MRLRKPAPRSATRPTARARRCIAPRRAPEPPPALPPERPALLARAALELRHAGRERLHPRDDLLVRDAREALDLVRVEREVVELAVGQPVLAVVGLGVDVHGLAAGVARERGIRAADHVVG